jgi:DegV family protein with EDD domain
VPVVEAPAAPPASAARTEAHSGTTPLADTALITDSCCDLSVEMTAAAGVEVLPFPYTLDGVEHLDDFGRTMPLSDFYAAIDDGSVAHTAQIPFAEYYEAFERAFAQGKSVLLVSLSSSLSGTYDTSLLARERFLEEHPTAEIHCVDSLCASGGEGLLVLEAARRLSEGAAAADVAAWLDANKARVNHYFTVDSFQHLVRGGRVSPAAGMAGGILNIKPVLRMDGQGRLVPLKTPRGRKRAIEMLADLACANADGQRDRTVIVSHGDCADDAAVLEGLLANRCAMTNVVETRIGVIIGTHTGGGVLSVYLWGADRGSDAG